MTKWEKWKGKEERRFRGRLWSIFTWHFRFRVCFGGARSQLLIGRGKVTSLCWKYFTRLRDAWVGLFAFSIIISFSSVPLSLSLSLLLFFSMTLRGDSIVQEIERVFKLLTWIRYTPCLLELRCFLLGVNLPAEPIILSGWSDTRCMRTQRFPSIRGINWADGSDTCIIQ